MKKLSLAIIVIVMTFVLVACGGEETSPPIDTVSLVEVTTEQGISLKLPSDMTLETIQGREFYMNTDTGDSVLYEIVDYNETSFTEWTEEEVLATYQSQYPDAVVQSYESGIEINENEALIAMIDVTTPEGNTITIAIVFINDGDVNYLINFTYGRENIEGSLAKNIQTCIDSIKIN